MQGQKCIDLKHDEINIGYAEKNYSSTYLMIYFNSDVFFW